MRGLPLLASIIFLTSCGGDGGSGGTPPPPPPPPVNTGPPVFTSAQTATVTENTTAAYQATATDPDGSPLTFSISGGADQSKFAITASGALTFTTAANFDLPGDAGGNNIYAVQISVSDGANSVSQTVNVSVINSKEGISVKRVGTGFNQPLYVSPIPGDSKVYVVEKGGGLYTLDPATGTKTLVLTVGNLSTNGERGLLSIAPLPDHASSRKLLAVATAPDGAVEIREYTLGSPGYTTILSTPHAAASNHNGGWIGFGPDGLIYTAIGDGGTGGGPAQDTNSRLGKILRLARSAGGTYSAAPGNPYAGGGGDPYVYARGLRNPFRASFSGSTLIIGDVGEGQREEIDFVTTTQPGLNFGWNFMEGTNVFSGSPPAGLTPPVAEYGHGSGPRQGNSITGGYVYRGPVTSLRDRYVFADFISNNIWSVPFASLVAGQTLASTQFERRNEDFAPDVGTIGSIASFGEDNAGNLFIVDIGGEIFMVQPG